MVAGQGFRGTAAGRDFEHWIDSVLPEAVASGAMTGIRPALPTERDVVAEIMYLDPEPEIVAICGSVERGRELGTLLVHKGIQGPAAKTLMLERDGSPVALMELWYPGQGLEIRNRDFLSVLLAARRIGGFALIKRYFAFQRARSNVDHPHPPDSLYIAHLNTHPDERGKGHGLALLEEAERLARGRVLPELSLDVYIGNPARRLYERFGFETVAELRDPVFERITGLPGYAAMVKDLR